MEVAVRYRIPGRVRAARWCAAPGEGVLGSLEPDAAIATTAEPGPAAGPGSRGAEELAASPDVGAGELEPLSGRPGHRGRDPHLADRCRGPLPGRATDQPGLRDLRRIALERLGLVVQRAGRCLYPPDRDRAGPRHGPAGRGGRPGGLIHGERGLAPGRTLLAEERRVSLRDGRPPGALQLGAARAGVDPRGPQQDHHRAPADRDHPRQPRRDRPARQAGRAGLQRRLHRQGRPDQRGRSSTGPRSPRRTRSSSWATPARASTPTASRS